MTAKQMSEAVHRFLEEANDVQYLKNRDYHPDDVAFLEILRTAFECGITVEQDLWAKIRKQYIALQSYVIGKKLESEPPRSRMIDVAVYMGMLACWEQNRLEILRGAAKFVLVSTPCEQKEKGGRVCLVGDEPCPSCAFYAWLENLVNQAR